MKLRTLFYALLATVVMAGCSNDENVTDNNGEDDANRATRYLSVNVISSSASGTRANSGEPGDAKYEDGSEAENKVSNVRFYFFDANGNAADVIATTDANSTTTYSNYYDATPTATQETESPNVEKILSATIVIRPKDKLPEKIVAIVNPMENETARKSLSQLQAIANDYSYDATKDFLMSSSAYLDGTTDMTAVTIKNENIQTSEKAALANPVDMYVERVLAKVRFSQGDQAINGASFDADGSIYIPARTSANDESTAIKTDDGKELYIHLLGWDITAKIDKSNLLKHISSTWNQTTNWGSTVGTWNYAAYHRSYWAYNPDGAEVKLPATTDKTSTSYSPFQAEAYGFKTNNVAYVQENASKSAESLDVTTPTKVIIYAELCTKEGDTNKPATIYQYANVNYTDESTCAGNMLQGLNLSYYKEDNNGDVVTGGTKYKKISAEDVKFVSGIASGNVTSYEINQNFKSYLALASADTKWYTISDNTATEVATETVTKALSGVGVYAQVFTGGKSYFYFDIQHLGYGITGVDFGQYGVVRNHIYDFSVTGITGLGTPVEDDTEIIVPEKPSKEYYVAARIKILSWRIVKNNISLDW